MRRCLLNLILRQRWQQRHSSCPTETTQTCAKLNRILILRFVAGLYCKYEGGEPSHVAGLQRRPRGILHSSYPKLYVPLEYSVKVERACYVACADFNLSKFEYGTSISNNSIIVCKIC